METDDSKLLRSEKLSKSYIKSNHTKLYQKIINFNSCFNDIKWKQQLYNYKKNITEIPKCYCGNSLKFIDYKKGYREFCSRKCMLNSDDIKEKRKKTNLKKYGVDNPSKSPEIRKKVEETNLKKFNAKYPLMNSDKMSESKKYFLEKYNVDNPSKLNFVQEKRQKTNKKLYGNENYFKTEDYISKTNKTKKKKYGDSNYNNRIKYRETMLTKYNVDNPMKSEDIRKKAINTNLKKYGKEYFTQTEIYRNNIKKTISEKNKKYFKEHGVKMVKNITPDSFILKCDKCNNEYNTTKQLFRKRVKNNEEPCVICNPFSDNTSSYENEIKDFINSLNIDYTQNDRNVLNGKEIDIFIPEYNLGIEFNGLYWHSELFKDKDYHFQKMLQSNDNKINLFQIWEDQWLYKKDIVKSMIKYKLNRIDNKIYARKCVIKEVDYKDAKEFLENNHLQGNSVSKFRYGLYYNNELVSLMTFSNLRKNLGQKSSSNNIELVRFCNKLDTVVVGSFSKLLTHYIKGVDNIKIMTYALCDHSNGNIYEKCGFQFEKYTKQNYYYFKNKIRYNRFSFRKDKLVSEGYDENLTEKEIMFQRGYNRIYDSGSIKYSLDIK
jgi:hypothetical protein